jgi:O-antigen ligase
VWDLDKIERINIKFKTQSKSVLLTCTLMTLFIIPVNIDPFSSPRLFILSVLSFIALVYLILSKAKIYADKPFKVFYLLVATFITLIIISAVVNHLSFSQLILGAWARNNGLAYYLSIFTLLIFVINLPNTAIEYSIVKILSYLGFVVNVYALLQLANFDYYNSIFPLYNTKLLVYSIFGNTNFYSAFFGFSFLANLGIVLNKNFSRKMRFFATISLLFSSPLLFVVDLQGLVIISLGSVAISYFWIHLQVVKNLKNKFFLKYIYLSPLLFISLITLILKNQNRLNRSELVSLEDRFYFWQSAIKMTGDNPWFGVGPDSYGNWVGIYRSKEFYNFRNELNTDAGYTDNAHNLLLQISSTLGIPALLLFCLIIFFVLWRSWIAYKVCNDKFVVFILIVIFCAYLLQSFVSIEHLGLGVWGWTIGGILVNLSIVNRIPQTVNQLKQFWLYVNKIKIIILLLVAILPIYVTVELIQISRLSSVFSNSILDKTFFVSKKNTNYLLDLAMNSNHAPFRNDIAIHLANTGNLQQALVLAEATSEKFPREIRSWVLLSKIYKNTDREKEYLNALDMLKKLEPLRY